MLPNKIVVILTKDGVIVKSFLPADIVMLEKIETDPDPDMPEFTNIVHFGEKRYAADFSSSEADPTADEMYCLARLEWLDNEIANLDKLIKEIDKDVEEIKEGQKKMTEDMVSKKNEIHKLREIYRNKQ